MMFFREFLGAAAVIIGLISFVPYLRDVLRNKTKPHVFSWFIWGVLGGIAFLAQVLEGAGPGAWALGVTTILCFVVAVLALQRGTRSFPISDWLALFLAGLSIGLWVVTDTPFWSVILVTVADVIGFWPTYRKGFFKPNEETMSQYVLAALKSILSLFALASYSISTWLYPASLVLTNGLFVLLLVWRRSRR